MTQLEQQADEAREAVVHDVQAIREKAEEVPARAGGAIVTVLGAATLGLAATAFVSGRRSRLLRSGIAGAACGIAAGFAMNQVHTLWSAAQKRLGPGSGADKTAASSEEPSTVKVMEAIAGPLPERDKAVAGSMAHFGMAAVTGAAYGVAHELLPVIGIGRGLGYGALVWAVADETAVPALGLSAPPWRYPAPVHLRALVAHLVFGFVLDGGLRLLGHR